MIERKYTNKFVTNFETSLNSDLSLFSKKLPIGMLTSMRHNIIAFQNAYNAYVEELKDIAEDHDTTIDKIGEVAANDRDIMDDLDDLLDKAVVIKVDPIRASLLTECSADKYDALTFTDLDILSPMLEETIE